MVTAHYALFFAVVAFSSAFAGSNNSAFAFEEYMRTDVAADGKVQTYSDKLEYLNLGQITPTAREALKRLKPGATRAAVLRDWFENEGIIPCEFLFRDPTTKGLVAVRIQWRPYEMSEEEYVDPMMRQKWVLRRAPKPDGRDFAVRISLPFRGAFVID